MTALLAEAFAPITAGEMTDTTVAADEVEIVVAAPDDAPAPVFRHRDHGAAVATWTYRDANGAVLGHVARFDTANGKVVLPMTWCRTGGRERWRWKSFPPPRPLYGLDRLAENPEAHVLVVEGEKTADAARAIFPDLVVVTWPSGTNAVDLADWSPLAGRRVTLWADADEPGRKAMAAVGSRNAAIAASVLVVPVPAGIPEGWDLADPVPEGHDPAALLESALPFDTAGGQLPGYRVTKRGLIWQDPADAEKPEILVAGPFEVLAETRDADGSSWGILLSWRDHDGRPHEWALPRALLAGDGVDARRMLLDGGLYVPPTRKARELLNAYLGSVRVPQRARAVSRIGWHDGVYVLPDATIGQTGGERVLLQTTGTFEHAFRVAGDLADWQQNVARHAVGNSRLVLAIATALAAPLLDIVDAESGGFHLRGASSTGKSTALVLAGSVWGGGGHQGFVRSWRATANGLEGVAATHDDCLLCLDELGQVAPREAGEVAYMLANGAGKNRAARDGSARRPQQWRLLFLSSGEIGLADKIAEDGRGRRAAAGQQVRIVDIPADAGAGQGLFEDLHGFADGDAFARHLKGAAAACYASRVREAIKGFVNDFTTKHTPAGADGQVARVAQRCALAAAAAELAVQLGILPWDRGEATAGIALCFRDWLGARGGTEPAEIRDGIAQIRRFLEAHGESRFTPWDVPDSDSGDRPTINRVGFRRTGAEGRTEFYVLPEAWKAELCAGFDGTALAKALVERGMLVPDKYGKFQSSQRLPGMGLTRCYRLGASILGGDDE